MILRAPLDPFSEVVDQPNRRWTPPWYSWLLDLYAEVLGIEEDLEAEPGSWTPSITFANPGDLSVSYSSQFGHYYRIGRLVFISFTMNTSAFSWATSSGNLQITGLPFESHDEGGRSYFAPFWQGITMAGFTDMTWELGEGDDFLVARMYASATNFAEVNATHVPSGGNLIFQGSGTYLAG